MDHETKEDAAELHAWYVKLLPFMMFSLIVMALLFFSLTVWHFRGLQERLTFSTEPIKDVIEQSPYCTGAPTPSAYCESYVRAVLEDTALRRRYQQSAAVIHARVWTRYMGFITGMVLSLTGCVFVLGRLRASVNASGKAQGLEMAFATSSPGLALAMAGAVLVGIALYVPVQVETHDVAVYLPRQVEVITPPAADAPGPPPNVEPSQPGDPEAGSGARSGAQRMQRSGRPLPPRVIEKLMQETERPGTGG